MKTKKQKSRRATRKTVLFNVWLQPLERERLERLSAKTGVDQSKLVRRAIGLLFDAFNSGQIELGFPEAIRPDIEKSTVVSDTNVETMR
jgi:hypothetical protein